MSPREKPFRILFICTGNSARSQMAEGLARRLGEGKVEAFSAGLEPKGLNPLAVAVMDEIGIDIRDQKSKGIDDDLIKGMDWVITVCGNAEERCPVLPGTVNRTYWPFDDPAAVAGSDTKRHSAFRNVRDELRKKIQVFLKDLPLNFS